jgi:hypothetical protein
MNLSLCLAQSSTFCPMVIGLISRLDSRCALKITSEFNLLKEVRYMRAI